MAVAVSQEARAVSCLAPAPHHPLGAPLGQGADGYLFGYCLEPQRALVEQELHPWAQKPAQVRLHRFGTLRFTYALLFSTVSPHRQCQSCLLFYKPGVPREDALLRVGGSFSRIPARLLRAVPA